MDSPDQKAELVLNLREQIAAQSALNAAIRADGLRFYKPHPKQEAFHRAGGFHRRALFAGNRFGKSQCGAAEDCSWVRGERPWFPEGDPARKAGIPPHSVKGIIVTTDWDKSDEIWTTQRGERPGKVWKYLPSGFVSNHGVRRNHSGAIDMIECVNGSVLRFDTVKSWLSNPMGSESSDWDFAHFDEPLPEQMFKAIARGLIDRGGSVWFTLTALSEPWIVDLFHKTGYGSTPVEGTWSITGTIYDNPYLSREAIAEYEALLTEDEKQCRLLGIPLHLAGLIYKSFSYAKHVLTQLPKAWVAFDDPPKDYSYYVTIDPHPQTPHAVLFCAVSPLGQRFYYADHFEHCTIEQLCRVIRRRLEGRHVVSVRIDPLAYICDPITDRTMADEFIRCGVIVEKAVKDLQNGIMKVNQELVREPQVMYFSPTVRRTLWEIQRYSWEPDGSNKPVDADDHMMENLYRMEMLCPRWSDPADHNVQVDDLVIPTASLDLTELEELNTVSTYGRR